jgi:formamidopyrimidine-DNA glycosylase
VPELPDVEVLRRYCEATSLHQEVRSVRVNSRLILGETSPSDLQTGLQGRTFEDTERHGKYLLVELDNGRWLVMHFGMTGSLKYVSKADRKPENTELLFAFSNGSRLAYLTTRKLGEIRLVGDAEVFIEEKDLGPDVLDSSFDFEAFQRAIAGRRAMIKSTLMNQQIMAGIGNVYSDEILFQAGIYPRTPVDELSGKAKKKVFHTMQDVLRTAIDNQADPEDFPETYIIPHRHKEGTCPRCGGEVKQVEVSGRGAYYCPRRQGKEAN